MSRPRAHRHKKCCLASHKRTASPDARGEGVDALDDDHAAGGHLHALEANPFGLLEVVDGHLGGPAVPQRRDVFQQQLVVRQPRVCGRVACQLEGSSLGKLADIAGLEAMIIGVLMDSHRGVLAESVSLAALSDVAPLVSQDHMLRYIVRQ